MVSKYDVTTNVQQVFTLSSCKCISTSEGKTLTGMEDLPCIYFLSQLVYIFHVVIRQTH